MQRCVWMLFLGMFALAGVGPLPAVEPGPVCVIQLREDISHNSLYLIRRGLSEAARSDARAIIIDMDTNGGSLTATEEIIKLLARAKITTYTYINTKAFSAGAIIASATDQIYMAPGSVIGAATPIMVIPGQGIQEIPAAEREKMNSATRALVRSTAQTKGHNPAVFEAMVDKDRGLIVSGVSVCATGTLLTLTSDEAGKLYGDPPTPLLSRGTLDSLDGLLTRLQFSEARVVTVKPVGFEVAARWLTLLSPLLIMIGMAAIYMEMKTPGLGVPAVVAVVCFGLYFLSHFIAGLAGWEDAALFVIGIALLIVELLFPGHFVSGIAGLICIVAGLVLAMAGRFPGMPLWPGWPDMQLPVLKVLGGFIGSTVLMAILARYLPQTRLFRQLELTATTSAAEGYTSARGTPAAVVGATGITETQLRPAGKARIAGTLVDVVSQGDLIERGTSVTIVAVEGSRVVVTPNG